MSRNKLTLAVAAMAVISLMSLGAQGRGGELLRQNRIDMSRMWIGGDSMAYQIAPTLSTDARGLGVSRVVSLCKSSSGLVRPDFFNWPRRLPAALRSLRPQAIVFMVGTNDGQGMSVAGTVYPFGSSQWKRAYRTRVAGMMKAMLAGGAKRVYWIGMPIMRNPVFGRKMALLNGIFREQARAHPGVVYVDAWRLFSTAGGAYAPRWRSSDGIHFNMAGVRRLSDAVTRLLKRDF